MRSYSSYLSLTAVFLGSAMIFAQGTPQSAPQGIAPGHSPLGLQGAAPIHGMRPDPAHPLMPIGTPAPDFSLPGVDGKTYTLADFSKAKLLVVVFESIHCPVSENYESRLSDLYNTYKGKGVAFVAINPNNPKAVRLDELGYTDLTDSPTDMKIRAKEANITWPFLYDGETQSTAQKFGAVATPHMFIFDADRKLRYEGRIDDNQNISMVKVHDAKDAIEALLAGGTVEVPHRPAFGCSTKWLSKAADVDREWAKIEAEPVTLKAASLDDLKALRANAGDNVTVVHFWNTAFKNGKNDFRNLSTTYRMYRRRTYNYVTVNTDVPANTAAVTSFLNAEHASNTNLQISPKDLKAVQDAFGSRWNASDEFTAVIAPGGKVIYAKEGPIDLLAVRHAALTSFTDNPNYPGQHTYWEEIAAR